MMKTEKSLWIISGLWMLVVVLIWPFGDFPLNDDWAYGWSVKKLFEGQLVFHERQAITLIAQLGWGWGFCKLFGFSFTVLRFSTLCLSLVGIFFIHRLYSLVTDNKRTVVVATVLTVFNPLYIELSNTFMTDIPALVFSVISAFFLFRFWRETNIRFIVVGSIFCLLAVFVRQTSLLVPISFGIAHLLTHRVKLSVLIIAILPFFITYTGLKTYEIILTLSGVLTSHYSYQVSVILSSLSHPDIELFKKIAYYTLNSMVGLGLFLFPYLLATLKKNDFTKRTLWFVFGISVCALLIRIFFTGNFFPLTGDVTYPAGLGPIILDGFNSNEPIITGIWSQGIWIIIGMVGLFSFSIFFTSIFRAIKSLSETDLFSILICLILLGTLVLNYVSDRYLLVLLPFVWVLILPRFQQFNSYILVLFSLPFLWFSVGGTRDYLSHHRTRQNAISYLEGENIRPEDIHGGMEYNFFSKAGEVYENSTFSDKKKFVISVKDRKENYLCIKTFSYNSWIEFRKKYLYILRAQEHQ